MASQIRYIAINAEQPDVLAAFYTRYFGMKELGQSSAGDVSLTDGFYNVSFLKHCGDLAKGESAGLSHFGVSVDDIRDIEGRPSRFAGDGCTNLALLAEPALMRKMQLETLDSNLKSGVNHFGFVVPNVQALLPALPSRSMESKRPAVREMAEYRIFDPEGNAIDLSQEKGCEVDIDIWERA